MCFALVYCCLLTTYFITLHYSLENTAVIHDALLCLAPRKHYTGFRWLLEHILNLQPCIKYTLGSPRLRSPVCGLYMATVQPCTLWNKDWLEQVRHSLARFEEDRMCCMVPNGIQQSLFTSSPLLLKFSGIFSSFMPILENGLSRASCAVCPGITQVVIQWRQSFSAWFSQQVV